MVKGEIEVAATTSANLNFSWDFLEEVSWWSLGLSAAVSAIAWVVTGGPAFALGCMLAVSIDFWFVRAVANAARAEIEAGHPGTGHSAALLFARLGSKAGLLVFSALIPNVLGFAGTVVGVLAFDLTLAVVGSTIAAVRLMHDPRLGR